MDLVMYVHTFLVAALVELRFKLLVDFLGLPFSFIALELGLAGFCLPNNIKITNYSLLHAPTVYN